MRPADVRYLVIHCSDSKWGDVETIRSWHAARGFSDVGYHYVITNAHPHGTKKLDPASDGRIHKGRAEDIAGAHAVGFNHKSLGICLVGRGEVDFTQPQMSSLFRLCRELMLRYDIPPERVLGHRETYPAGTPPAKSCPNMDMNAVRAVLPICL